MLDETKEVIELMYSLSNSLKKSPVKDIMEAGTNDFFKCLYYDRNRAGRQYAKTGMFYQILRTVSGGGTDAEHLTPMTYLKGTSFTVWAMDPLEVGGDLDEIIIVFDGTSKQLIITADNIKATYGEPVQLQ